VKLGRNKDEEEDDSTGKHDRYGKKLIFKENLKKNNANIVFMFYWTA